MSLGTVPGDNFCDMVRCRIRRKPCSFAAGQRVVLPRAQETEHIGYYFSRAQLIVFFSVNTGGSDKKNRDDCSLQWEMKRPEEA